MSRLLGETANPCLADIPRPSTVRFRTPTRRRPEEFSRKAMTRNGFSFGANARILILQKALDGGRLGRPVRRQRPEFVADVEADVVAFLVDHVIDGT